MEKQVWDFLKAEGFNDYGAAGLMGNLDAESSLRSNNLQDTYSRKFGLTDIQYTAAVDNGTYTNFVRDEAGYGLAQWTYWSRKQNLLNYAKSKNKSIGDLEMQLGFLCRELRENYTNSVYNVLKSATSVQQASDAVLMNFERPYNAASYKLKRASMGQVYYNKYAGSTSKKEVYSMIEFKKGRTDKIAPNFQYKEFDCQGKGCCSTTIIDEKLVAYIQQIRDHFGKPITITSPYRCETHNKRVGGGTLSYHMQGKAADIVVQGVSSREVAKYAESIGILGVGLYETAADGYFTHIDTRTEKCYWYGQKEEPRSTFGGNVSNTTTSNVTAPVSTYHKTTTKYNIQLIYLQKGDKGRDVQVLQELLKNRGYKVETSGEFDSATYAAVKDFQKKTNQPQDGVVGAKTMEKLLTA